jgi:glc operon protein GlcG
MPGGEATSAQSADLFSNIGYHLIMQSKKILGITEVSAILEAAKAEATKNGWAVSIVVADDGGHPLGLLRLDGCGPSTTYIATEKARTSAMGRRETKLYEESINNGRTAFLSAPLSGLLEGGVPVIVDGHVIGSVGVSGVKPEQDAQVAKAGVAAVAG